MTTTIERPSLSQELPKPNLEFIPDEQLQTEISKKIESLDTLYRSYLSNPSEILEDWKDDLHGLESDDYDVVLAELCINSKEYFPSFSEDENPSVETISLYNQLREAAYEYITTDRTSDIPFAEPDSILQKRMTSRLNGQLNSVRQSRPTNIQGSTFFANEIPSKVESHVSKKLELSEEYEAELEADLKDFAEQYAAKLAKESDRSLGQLFHEESDAHIREELTDMMGGIATHLMDKAEASGISEDVYPALIESKLTEVTDMIIEKMADARMQEYNSSSFIRKVVYSTWSKWGKQGKLGTVKKGIVMGAVTAPVALIAAPIAGATVGVGIVGALIATGSRSLGRGLISSHINQKANAPENIDKSKHELRSKVLEYKLESGYNEINSFNALNVIDSTVDKYRRRNRRRVLGGVGIAMSVGLVSATLAEYISDVKFGATPANANDTVNTNRHPLSIFKNENTQDGISSSSSDDRVDMGVPAENESDHTERGREYNSGSDMSSGPETQTSEQTNGKLGREGMFEGRFGTRHLSLEGKKAALEAFDGYRVESGDSIWSLSEQLCREQGISNPTVYEIDATKDLLLEELQSSGSVNENGELIAGSRLSIH